jgi:GNAT superfamily N-acetyltransferase
MLTTILSRALAIAARVRRSDPSDLQPVLSLVAAHRAREAAACASAMATLSGASCATGEVIHCWVATDHAGEVIGVCAAIDHGHQVSLHELLVEPGSRRLGIGLELLGTLLDFADARRVPIITLVRGSDVEGLSWLCDRGFVPSRFTDGRTAIVSDAFVGEACEEGIGLHRPAPCGAHVRIAE